MQLICTLLYVMTTPTCIRILYCSVYPQLPPVIGAPCAGTLRGYILPVHYGSVGVQPTRLRALCQGTLTSECVWKNLNATVVQVTCTMQQSSRVFLFACLKACFRLSLSTRNKKKRTVTSKKHAYRPETSYCVYYSLKYAPLTLGLDNSSCEPDEYTDFDVFQTPPNNARGTMHCTSCWAFIYHLRSL